MQNVLLTENKKFILKYDKGNYEQMKSLFNQDSFKKIEDCEDVSDQYDMLLDLLYEAIDKDIPRISLTNNKFSRKITLNRPKF